MRDSGMRRVHYHGEWSIWPGSWLHRLREFCPQSQENLWDVFLQSILGKLYVISLFVIL